MAASALRLTAPQLLDMGLIDGVVPEPAGGAHTDHIESAEALRQALHGALDELSEEPVDVLLKERRRRLRSVGRTVDETGEAGDDGR